MDRAARNLFDEVELERIESEFGVPFISVSQPTECTPAGSSAKIGSGLNGGPALAAKDQFGVSVTSVGDLDGDGVTDLAVGAFTDDGGPDSGAVYVLLMNGNQSVKTSRKIASGENAGPPLDNGDCFGWAVSNLGDVNGDGITDLAVGTPSDDTGG